MKKVLSAVAALGLVASVATTASALEFKISGHYFLEGVYMSSGDDNGLVLNDDDQGNNSYWRHEFKIRPVMKVNDKIVMKSAIYLANSDVVTNGTDGIWGGQDDTSVADGDTISVQQLYMEYMSPYGKLRVGRTSAGLWQGDFLSSDIHGNRIMFFPNFLGENIGGCVFLQKIKEGDKYTTAVDGDSDLYEAAVWYKTNGMIASLGWDYFRTALKGDAVATSDGTATKHVLKGYYNQNFSKVYAEVEFAYIFGDTDYDNELLQLDYDTDAFGIMTDVGMNMDRLDVGVMFIYASGDDDLTAGSDNESLTSTTYGLGEQFQPYNILTGANTGMMSTDVNKANTDMTRAGIVSAGVHATYAVSDKLSVNSALAYAQAESELNGFDDEYGWEIDLGVSYSLMDNLAYQVDFGYLMTGDFFDHEYVGGAVVAVGDAEDIFTLTHRLTMEF